MANKVYQTTTPLPGDDKIVLLGKLVQSLGGDVSPNDSENTLLAKLLNRVDGLASPGDTDAQILAKILSQLVCP